MLTYLQRSSQLVHILSFTTSSTFDMKSSKLSNAFGRMMYTSNI